MNKVWRREQINQPDISYFNSSKHSHFFHFCQIILIISGNFCIKIRMIVVKFHSLSLKNLFLNEFTMKVPNALVPLSLKHYLFFNIPTAIFIYSLKQKHPGLDPWDETNASKSLCSTQFSQTQGGLPVYYNSLRLVVPPMFLLGIYHYDRLISHYIMPSRHVSHHQ